jgi:hypothetical protein
MKWLTVNFSKCEAPLSQNISSAYIIGLAKEGSVLRLFSIATFLNALRNTTQNQINFGQPFQRTFTNLLPFHALNMHRKKLCIPKVKLFVGNCK